MLKQGRGGVRRGKEGRKGERKEKKGREGEGRGEEGMGRMVADMIFLFCSKHSDQNMMREPAEEPVASPRISPH